MTALNAQEYQIIQSFSSVSIPEKIIRDSNIKELVNGMLAEQESVKVDAQRLERLRQEKKDGNFVGNWWGDLDDKVQDAQIDLNKTIGRLTQKSSQLLIVNTAITKVLNDQQRILLEQQNTLKHQTDTLREQNNKILEQQVLLEQQQRDINKANQGLLETKGITQEQAQKLIGCVKLVREAEDRIREANKTLQSDMERLNMNFFTQSQHTQAELELFAENARKLKIEIEQQLQVHAQTVLETISAQHAKTQQLHATVKDVMQQREAVLHEQTRNLKTVEVNLAALQASQQKNAIRIRLTVAMAVSFSLVALGWQIAKQFAMI